MRGQPVRPRCAARGTEGCRNSRVGRHQAGMERPSWWLAMWKACARAYCALSAAVANPAPALLLCPSNLRNGRGSRTTGAVRSGHAPWGAPGMMFVQPVHAAAPLDAGERCPRQACSGTPHCAAAGIAVRLISMLCARCSSTGQQVAQAQKWCDLRPWRPATRIKPTRGICRLSTLGKAFVGPCPPGASAPAARHAQTGASFHAAHGKASHLFSLAAAADQTIRPARRAPTISAPEPKRAAAPLDDHVLFSFSPVVFLLLFS